MGAAALTPTSVQSIPLVTHKYSGTAMRIEKYLIKVTKATQNDWVVTATYVPGTVINAKGYTIDSSGDGVEETNTYTASGTKLTLTSATVGTTYMEVTVSR